VLRDYSVSNLTASVRSGDSLATSRTTVRQYELCAALGDLNAGRNAAGSQHLTAAVAYVDSAVLRFHRAAPSDAVARVSFHLNVAKLFERSGFDVHALSGLETAVMSERTGLNRPDMLVQSHAPVVQLAFPALMSMLRV
jgi:hypothetical protein